MNKTLTALLLALTSAWAVDQNPVVEMYPDDMPKSQFVKTIKKKVTKEWKADLEKGSQALDTFYADIHKFLESKNFSKVTNCRNSINFRSDYLLKVTGESSIRPYVFLQVNEENLIMDDEKRPIEEHPYVYTSITTFQKNKWELITKKPQEQGETRKNAYPLSWHYIDLVIHETSIFYETLISTKWPKEIVKFYSVIREKDLQNTISRAMLVAHQDRHYDLLTLYDTEEEQITVNPIHALLL